MGLGGYLTWTATAREIRKKYGKQIKILPVEQHGSFLKYVQSEVFENNDDFCNNLALEKDKLLLPLVLNNPNANYCKKDTPEKTSKSAEQPEAKKQVDQSKDDAGEDIAPPIRVNEVQLDFELRRKIRELMTR